MPMNGLNRHMNRTAKALWVGFSEKWVARDDGQQWLLNSLCGLRQNAFGGV